MALLLCFMVLFVACNGENYGQLQQSPELIGAVPYGNSYISVWEYATTKGRYYALTPPCLQSETARVVENVFSGTTQLDFDVLLWSREAQQTVHDFLKTYVNASITKEQVEALTMERIRLVSKSRPLPDYQLADQWRSNTHLLNVVTFSVTCRNNEKCQQLQRAIRTRPSTFNDLKMEYEIDSQRSARLTVEGRHLVGGSLYASLESMPISTPIRYLRTEDVKRLTAETLENAISSQVTDGDRIDAEDKIGMSDLLKRVFEETAVSTADLDPAMWESVYWNPAKARPDKKSSYLNKVVTRDGTNSSNFSINQSQRTFYGLAVNAGGEGGSSCRASVRKESLLQTLRERDIAVQWTGQRFVIKPLVVFRLNLTALNAATNLVTSHVRLRRHDSVQSIKLRVSCDVNQTSRLVPEPVRADTLEIL